MAAIVTNKFRIANANNFKQDLGDTATSVYVYIAKSDAWSNTYTDLTDTTAPSPQDQSADEFDVHDDMIAMKLLSASDVSHVVPRHNWTNGNVYAPYDDADADVYDKNFYVVTDEFKVYKCIIAGDGASVVKPIHTDTGYPQLEGDGYMWKYMYTLQASDTDKFLTNFYMPVKTVVIPDGGVLGDLSTDDQTQYNSQVASETANNGAIFRIVIEDGGSGYDQTPTITIVGDGNGCTVNAGDITIENGVITNINVSNYGTGYNQAKVVISGGGNGVGAVARAVVSPGNGHGTDPVKELGGFFIATNVKLEYADGAGDFTVDNSFRQVGLIRNPLNHGTTTIATDNTLSGLQYLTLGGTDVVNFSVGDTMEGQTSGALALIDAVDEATGTVKYHQNFKTGYTAFQSGETVNGLNGGSGTSAVLGNPEYERYSGDILFIENRDPINRYDTQIEDVKIIIEF